MAIVRVPESPSVNWIEFGASPAYSSATVRMNMRCALVHGPQKQWPKPCAAPNVRTYAVVSASKATIVPQLDRAAERVAGADQNYDICEAVRKFVVHVTEQIWLGP